MTITKAQLKKLQQDFNSNLTLTKKKMDGVFSDCRKKIDSKKITSLKNKINSL